MNADLETDVETVHTAIVNRLAAAFPTLNVIAYDPARDKIDTPACHIEMEEMEGAHDADPGTGQLALRARFVARLIISFRQGTANPQLEVRKLAGSVAAFVHQQRWGLPITPAVVEGVYPDDFSPELDQFHIWQVEWNQIIHLGESVWDDDGLTAPDTVYIGHAPDIGPDGDYQQVTE